MNLPDVNFYLNNVTEDSEMELVFSEMYKIIVNREIKPCGNFGLIRNNESQYNFYPVIPLTIKNRFTYRPSNDIAALDIGGLSVELFYPEVINEYCPEEYKYQIGNTIVYGRQIKENSTVNVITDKTYFIPSDITEINDPIFSDFGLELPYYDGCSKEITLYCKVVAEYMFTKLQNIYIPLTYDEFWNEYLETYSNDEENKILRLSNWTNNTDSYFKWSTKHIDDGNGNTKDIEYRSGVNYTGNFVFTDKTVPSTDFIQNPDDLN